VRGAVRLKYENITQKNEKKVTNPSRKKAVPQGRENGGKKKAKEEIWESN